MRKTLKKGIGAALLAGMLVASTGGVALAVKGGNQDHTNDKNSSFPGGGNGGVKSGFVCGDGTGWGGAATGC